MNLKVAGLAFSVLIVLVVVGCGKGSSEDGMFVGSKSETYRYEYESNGCNTGSHSFSNLGELCEALQSRATNRGCALSLRQDGFKDWNCPGTFQEKPKWQDRGLFMKNYS